MTESNDDWAEVDASNEELLVSTLESARVLLTGGHFVLKAHNHSTKFVNVKGLYPHVFEMDLFCRALALRITRVLGPGTQKLSGVVGPVMGGVALAQGTAKWLGQVSQDLEDEPVALFAEKGENDQLFFGRGYDEYIHDGIFVIVEDVMTSGSTVAELVKLIESHGGIVAFIVAIWNRGAPDEVANVPVISLINRGLPSVSEADCKATGPCSRGVAINLKHGHGAAYVEAHGQPESLI